MEYENFENKIFDLKDNYLSSLNDVIELYEKITTITKNQFLYEDFKFVDNSIPITEINSIVFQFIDYNGLIAFSKNDKEITLKLKKVNYPVELLKVRVCLYEIKEELIKLLNNEKILIFPHAMMVAIIEYVECIHVKEIFNYFSKVHKFKSENIENKLKITGRKFDRILNKNKFKNLTKSLNYHESLIFKEFKDKLNNLTPEMDIKITRLSINYMDKQFLEIISQVYLINSNKNYYFKSLFNLLKTFTVNKELLNEEDFIKRSFKSNNDNYDDNYDFYKLKRVKAILRIR